MEELKGFLFPFKRGADGNFMFGGGNDLTKSDLKTVVMIDKGERPILKDIGSIISKALFGYVDNISSQSLVKSYLLDPIRENVPNVIVEEEDITMKEIKAKPTENEKNVLLVRIEYESTLNELKDNVEIPFILE